MQAERGCTTERRSGRRAATTFTKLPTAKPGANATAASAAFIFPLSAALRGELSAGGFGLLAGEGLRRGRLRVRGVVRWHSGWNCRGRRERVRRQGVAGQAPAAARRRVECSVARGL